MTIQQFIEKAIAGGWNSNHKDLLALEATGAILLDPEAWKAVGKVEGWYEYGCRVHADANQDGCGIIQTRVWLNKMHRMIDALAEGKTIEEYLEKL